MFTASHRGTSGEPKSLKGLREEMFRCHSMRLAGIAFQGCSFNHSDISPFRIIDLRALSVLGSADCDHLRTFPVYPRRYSSLGETTRRVTGTIVGTLCQLGLGFSFPLSARGPDAFV